MTKVMRLSWILVCLLCVPQGAQDHVPPPAVQGPAAPPRRTVCAGDAEDPALARLCAWLETDCQVANASNVFFADFDHGGVPVRGLGLVSDVREDDHIFCVPRHCWITNETFEARLAEIGNATSSICTEENKMVLAIAEEQSRGSDSFFHPYFASLPSEKDYRRYHPAYLERYRLHPQIDHWRKWLARLKKCHAERQPPPRPLAPTWSELKLAQVHYASRVFEFCGMTPLVDMINHGRGNVYEGSKDPDNFCVTAQRDLPAGTELLYNYDSGSPMMMLTLYGIVVPPLRAKRKRAGRSKHEPKHCSGLRPEEFQLPANHSPVLETYALFAKHYCSEEQGNSTAGNSTAATSAAPPRTDL